MVNCQQAQNRVNAKQEESKPFFPQPEEVKNVPKANDPKIKLQQNTAVEQAAQQRQNVPEEKKFPQKFSISRTFDPGIFFLIIILQTRYLMNQDVQLTQKRRRT